MTTPPSVIFTFPATTEPWDHRQKGAIGATPPLPLQRLVRFDPAPSSVPTPPFPAAGSQCPGS